MIVATVCSFSEKTIRWVHTLRQTGYDGKVVIFMTGDFTDVQAQALAETYNAMVGRIKSVPPDCWKQAGGARLCWRWGVIEKLGNDNPDETILVTDTWDVIFQDNPQLALTTPLADDEVVISDEGILFGNDPTSINTNWVMATKQFSQQHFDSLPADWAAKPVFNGGIVAAKGSRMAQVARSIFNWTFRSLNDQIELNRLFWSDSSLKPVFNRKLSVCLNSQPTALGKGVFVYNADRSLIPAIVHANGDNVKPLLEDVYPSSNYMHIMKRMALGVRGKDILRPTLAVEIPTKGRTNTTLPMTLKSILLSEVKPDKVTIYNDNQEDNFPAMYAYIAAEFAAKGVNLEFMKGSGQGQVVLHEHARKNADTDLVMRIDDDCQVEVGTIGGLVASMQPDTGAIGCLVIDPSKLSPKPNLLSSRIEDVKWSPNRQWFLDPDPKVYEVGHLYSAFIYKRLAANQPYCNRLSVVGHREETLFSHSIAMQGWKLLVDSRYKIWHYRYPEGGIRSQTDNSVYEKDEAVFNQEMASRGVRFNEVLPVNSAHGLGDNYALLNELNDICEHHKDKIVVVGTSCPSIFEGRAPSNCVITSFPDAMQVFGPQVLNSRSVYNFMSTKKWTDTIGNAYRELYGLPRKEQSNG